MNSSILLLGSYTPNSYIRELINDGVQPDFASINLQNAIVKGLEENHQNVNIISAPNRQSFPKSQLANIKPIKFNHHKNLDKGTDLIIGYVNLPIIKMISKFLNTRRAIKEYLRTTQNSKVIIYGLHSPFLLATLPYAKRFGSICVVIPDLPEYMSGNINLLYRIAKYFDRKIIIRCLKRADCFILLSDKMKEKLNIRNKPTDVIEGIYSDIQETTEKSVSKNKKSILYAGSINKRYNIYDLIESVHRIKDSDIELLLCGPIDNHLEFNRLIKKDNRIKYLGLLENQEVRKLQRTVSLLINPRFSNEEYTKYSFPSKTLEYLASGTPTMMCHLHSMPEDYLNHVYLIENESIEGIKDALVKFFKTPIDEREQRGKNARDFILNNKTEFVQARKIIKLLNCKE